MAKPSTPFAVALSEHRLPRLREAFEACNEAQGTSYNRTTLGRWLERSVPRDEAFVRCLAERLEDPAILSGWEQARSSGPTSTVDSAVDGFRQLSKEDRARAFPEIRQAYLEQYSSVRSRFNLRIDLYDDVESDEIWDLRLVLRWIGRLPENAKVAYVTEQSELGDRFAEDDCIFRDAVDMSFDQLDGKLGACEQTVSYKRSDEDNPTFTTLDANYVSDGVFRFDNETVDNAEIRLDLQYPYPKHRRDFPIRFGKYQVAGMAEIVFAPHSDSVSNPRCNMPFMPPGQERAWASSLPRGELVVYLGSDDTLLSEGDGVVLSWT